MNNMNAVASAAGVSHWHAFVSVLGGASRARARKAGTVLLLKAPLSERKDGPRTRAGGRAGRAAIRRTCDRQRAGVSAPCLQDGPRRRRLEAGRSALSAWRPGRLGQEQVPESGGI